MASLSETVPSSKEEGLERTAQAGYLTKGVLYVLIGVMSLRAAIGFGGEISGSKDAVKFIAGQPFGRILLVLVSIGVGCYALWRLAKVFIGSSDEAGSKKDIVKRIGYAASGLTHVALTVFCVSLLIGSSSGGGGGISSKATSLLGTSWGPWLLGAISLGVLVASFVQFKHAWDPSIEEKIDTTSLSPKVQKGVVKVYQIGSMARGVVFGIIGFFLIRTAYQSSTVDVTSSKDALQKIVSMPYGTILLGIVAFGLFCYGVSCLVQGRYKSVSALSI